MLESPTGKRARLSASWLEKSGHTKICYLALLRYSELLKKKSCTSTISSSVLRSQCTVSDPDDKRLAEKTRYIAQT